MVGFLVVPLPGLFLVLDSAPSHPRFHARPAGKQKLPRQRSLIHGSSGLVFALRKT